MDLLILPLGGGGGYPVTVVEQPRSGCPVIIEDLERDIKIKKK